MSTTCNVCRGTGFINLCQFEDVPDIDNWTVEQIDRYMKDPRSGEHDVAICGCCGDGEGWYGIPGEHYNSEDPPGNQGPYAGNGGLCKCH